MTGHNPQLDTPTHRKVQTPPVMAGQIRLPEDEKTFRPFRVQSDFTIAGDQPRAIDALTEGLREQRRDQVLLGVTGSGKTFTMAHVIAETGRPSLVLAPNKTLAAQLYGEMKSFFPDNAVEYFVSYYDFYQPEAYVPRLDLYIDKEATINEQIDRMRHSATRSLLERRDVVIVASVSCIYGIGAVETYGRMIIDVEAGQVFRQRDFLHRLVELQYKRNDQNIIRGHFRVRGDSVEIFPAHLEDCAWRLSFFGDAIESIVSFDPLTGKKRDSLENTRFYPNSHFVTPRPSLQKAIASIRRELKAELARLHKEDRRLEAQRLEQRTLFDLEMMETVGICPGIENYSRHLTGRAPGQPPPTLFEYLPEDALLIVDESHVTVPQLGGMYRGDFNRKTTLAEYGFRLPSCVDNRPLKFEEWERMRPQTIFVSATPGDWEVEQTRGVVVDQIVRPTGLIDPLCILRPCENQVDDLLGECRRCAERKQRVLVTTLTKKMAEDLAEYMEEAGLKSRYLHSDIETLERIEIIRDLRRGVFDILIGINLLREGLDIPECALVAILDADKEGFLRSKRSLIQTIGRAARHVDGRAILYADTMTDSLEYAISETERRRRAQTEWNETHGITPESVRKNIEHILESVHEQDRVTIRMNDSGTELSQIRLGDYITMLERSMKQAAETLDFEQAAKLRDEIRLLEAHDLDMPADSVPVNRDLAASVEKTHHRKKPAGAEKRNRRRRGV